MFIIQEKKNNSNNYDNESYKSKNKNYHYTNPADMPPAGKSSYTSNSAYGSWYNTAPLPSVQAAPDAPSLQFYPLLRLHHVPSVRHPLYCGHNAPCNQDA